MLHFQILFLDIGGPEMMLIMVAALLMFGGQKLPELARGLGKGIRDFKDAANGVKDDLQDSMTKLQEEHANITNGLNIVDSHNQPYTTLSPVVEPSTHSSQDNISEAVLVDEHNHPLTGAVVEAIPAIITSSNAADIAGNRPLITPASSESIPYSANAAILTSKPEIADALTEQAKIDHSGNTSSEK